MQINAIKSCDMNFNRSPVVVARNKQNFTFISFNAGTVLKFINHYFIQSNLRLRTELHSENIPMSIIISEIISTTY